jgi:hypothetical protein
MTPMVHMLFAYHRPTLAVETLGTFGDYDAAWKERVVNERRLMGQPGIEVVILSGKDEPTIRRTHARYFGGSNADASIERAVADWRNKLLLPPTVLLDREPVAVLCTSDAAFQSARFAATLETVAQARDALLACGQTVEYAGTLPEGIGPNDLIVWICGANTAPDEWIELFNRPNPMISLGVCLSSVPIPNPHSISIDPSGKSPAEFAAEMRQALSSLSFACHAS